MDSTMEQNGSETVPHSVSEAWRHAKQTLTAASLDDGWRNFKKMLEALPPWALVVAIVSVISVVANPWVIPILVTVGCGMAAVFYTVKHAVRQALREHDSQRPR